MVSDGYAVSMVKEPQAIRCLVGQTSCLATIAWMRGCTEPRHIGGTEFIQTSGLCCQSRSFLDLWLKQSKRCVRSRCKDQRWCHCRPLTEEDRQSVLCFLVRVVRSSETSLTAQLNSQRVRLAILL